MIIINTTFHIHKSIENDFCRWVRNEYIPAALSSGWLSVPAFSRIMLEVQEDCSSFAVSFKARNVDDGEGENLRRSLNSRFGEKALFFSTYMDELPL